MRMSIAQDVTSRAGALIVATVLAAAGAASFATVGQAVETPAPQYEFPEVPDRGTSATFPAEGKGVFIIGGPSFRYENQTCTGSNESPLCVLTVTTKGSQQVTVDGLEPGQHLAAFVPRSNADDVLAVYAPKLWGLPACDGDCEVAAVSSFTGPDLDRSSKITLQDGSPRGLNAGELGVPLEGSTVTAISAGPGAFVLGGPSFSYGGETCVGTEDRPMCLLAVTTTTAAQLTVDELAREQHLAAWRSGIGVEELLDRYAAKIWDLPVCADGCEAGSIYRFTDARFEGSEDVSRPVPIAAPALAGLETGPAGDSLDAAGFAGSMFTLHSSLAPKGTVVSQSPAAGTLVDPGASIRYAVSKGPRKPDKCPDSGDVPIRVKRIETGQGKERTYKEKMGPCDVIVGSGSQYNREGEICQVFMIVGPPKGSVKHRFVLFDGAYLLYRDVRTKKERNDLFKNVAQAEAIRYGNCRGKMTLHKDFLDSPKP